MATSGTTVREKKNTWDQKKKAISINRDSYQIALFSFLIGQIDHVNDSSMMGGDNTGLRAQQGTNCFLSALIGEDLH